MSAAKSFGCGVAQAQVPLAIIGQTYSTHWNRNQRIRARIVRGRAAAKMPAQEAFWEGNYQIDGSFAPPTVRAVQRCPRAWYIQAQFTMTLCQLVQCTCKRRAKPRAGAPGGGGGGGGGLVGRRPNRSGLTSVRQCLHAQVPQD